MGNSDQLSDIWSPEDFTRNIQGYAYKAVLLIVLSACQGDIDNPQTEDVQSAYRPVDAQEIVTGTVQAPDIIALRDPITIRDNQFGNSDIEGFNRNENLRKLRMGSEFYLGNGIILFQSIIDDNDYYLVDTLAHKIVYGSASEGRNTKIEPVALGDATYIFNFNNSQDPSFVSAYDINRDTLYSLEGVVANPSRFFEVRSFGEYIRYIGFYGKGGGKYVEVADWNPDSNLKSQILINNPENPNYSRLSGRMKREIQSASFPASHDVSIDEYGNIVLNFQKFIMVIKKDGDGFANPLFIPGLSSNDAVNNITAASISADLISVFGYNSTNSLNIRILRVSKSDNTIYEVANINWDGLFSPNLIQQLQTLKVENNQLVITFMVPEAPPDPGGDVYYVTFNNQEEVNGSFVAPKSIVSAKSSLGIGDDKVINNHILHPDGTVELWIRDSNPGPFSMEKFELINILWVPVAD